MKKLLTILLAIAFGSTLASWNTFHGNNQRTGRSSAFGPTSPVTHWTFDMNGPIINSPVIGPDGTIYTGAVLSDTLQPRVFVYAIRPDGTSRWRHEIPFYDDLTTGSPAIGPEGNVYVGTATGTFLALDSNGEEVWRYQALSKISTHPAVSDNGTVYVKMDDFLFAFSAAGQVQWQFPLGSNYAGSPAIATDGTIYVHGASGLHAINPNGSQKWLSPGFDSFVTPAVADNGNIIVADSWVKALRASDGAVLWSAPGTISGYSAAAIDSQGNVYAVYDWNLTKYSSTGQVLWEREFLYEVNRLESSWSAPVVDAANRLYFNLGTGKQWALDSAKGIVAYSATGTKLFNFLMPETPSTSNPAMAGDGTIYVGCLDGKLYAIGNAWTQVLATSHQLVRGRIGGGTFADLNVSDDQGLQLLPGPVLVSNQSPIQLVLEGALTSSTVSNLRFVIESSASVPNVVQKLEFFNFALGSWTQADSRNLTLTDNVALVAASPASQFIETGTKRVRTRLTFKASGPVLAYPWVASLDRAIWQYN